MIDKRAATTDDGDPVADLTLGTRAGIEAAAGSDVARDPSSPLAHSRSQMRAHSRAHSGSARAALSGHRRATRSAASTW
jgi:hypothetical protein